MAALALTAAEKLLSVMNDRVLTVVDLLPVTAQKHKSGQWISNFGARTMTRDDGDG